MHLLETNPGVDKGEGNWRSQSGSERVWSPVVLPFFWQDSLAGCGIDQPLFGFSGILLLCAFSIVALSECIMDKRKEGRHREKNHMGQQQPYRVKAYFIHTSPKQEPYSNKHRNVHEYSSKRSKGELCENCSSRFHIMSYWSCASTVALAGCSLRGRFRSVTQRMWAARAIHRLPKVLRRKSELLTAI